MLYTEDIVSEQVVRAIPDNIQDKEWHYFHSFTDMNVYNTAVVSPEALMAGDYHPEPESKNIISAGYLNEVSELNNFIEKANRALLYDGKLAGKFHSTEARKKKIRENHTSTLIFYMIYIFDFIWHRVFPKFKFTRSFYEKMSNGTDRVYASAELLGRLAAGGFEIVDHEQFEDETYFIIKKTSEPDFEAEKPNALIFTMSRISKGGEEKNFYKLRTMHQYTEYLQHFVYRNNGLSEGGKFKNDFRITRWGRYLRKFWLDELPMLYNLVKGDLKLIGVRPLSSQYFNLYEKRFQERRKKYKPGLIPPFYVDLPETLEEIMASERKYMMAYDKSPVWTDISYFFRIIYNIIIKHARSK
jgi:lipopolysaccharide/colanic/teichoic acid biosynthesis glycosyltransferase